MQKEEASCTGVGYEEIYRRTIDRVTGKYALDVGCGNGPHCLNFANKGFQTIGNQMKALLLKDFSGYLPDDLLVKVDIASMANSLEVRCPFLDHKLIEQMFGIPTHMKIRNGITKYALKKSFEGILPDEILYREKAGFAIPLDLWLRHDLKGWSYDIILDPSMKEFFDLLALEKLLNAHQTSNQGSKVWTLLMFSLWHHTFMENAVQCQLC